MDFIAICKKYQEDIWGECKYRVRCDKTGCVNNCAIEEDKVILKEKDLYDSQYNRYFKKAI